MNAALYIRVSTEDQIELSPDSQKQLLLDYAKKNGIIVDDEHIFMDEGISGRKAEKRPQFMNMIALAKSKSKPFQKILVWKFSRFARNQEESIVYKNMLRKDGVDVISISEPIIEGPFGSLIERIIEWMDEYYSIRLSSEVIRGMTEKAHRGGVQSSKAFGYTIINNKYIVVPDQANTIMLIFEKFLDGLSCNEIAEYINIRGARTNKGNMFEGRNIKYILQNPVYCGLMRWNYSDGGRKTIKDKSEWIIVDGEHEPIISKETYYKAQEILALKDNSSNKKPTSTEYKHWLGGLLRCSECGSTLTYTAYSKSSLGPNSKYLGYFLCNKYKKKSCTTKNFISIKQAEGSIIDALKEDLIFVQNNRYEELNIRRSQNTEDIELIQKQLDKMPSRLKKAKDLYINGIDTLEEFSETKNELLKEQTLLKTKLTKLKSNKVDAEKISEKIQTAISLISNNEDKKKINTFLKTFIDKIVINRSSKTFDIYYFQ
nr:recombinase family protein [uncultured Cellulosilyticum sp.]